MKTALAIFTSVTISFFVGRWEGKTVADEYYSRKPIKSSPPRIIRGMHFTGKCFLYPGNDTVVYKENTFTINSDRPCIISPGPVGLTTENENEEAPRFEQ